MKHVNAIMAFLIAMGMSVISTFAMDSNPQIDQTLEGLNYVEEVNTLSQKADFLCELAMLTPRNENGQYRCPLFCGFQALGLHRLKIHMSSHSDDRPFPCSKCEKRFKLEQTLIQHKKSHNKTRRPYRCKVRDCKWIGGFYRSDVTRHMERTHACDFLDYE